MSPMIWILIPLVAIVGGLLLEYQKTKMKMMEHSRQNDKESDELRALIASLKGRVENLEAIAAGEPEEFRSGAGAGMSEIEIDESDIKEENKREVSNLAEKRRNR